MNTEEIKQVEALATETIGKMKTLSAAAKFVVAHFIADSIGQNLVSHSMMDAVTKVINDIAEKDSR